EDQDGRGRDQDARGQERRDDHGGLTMADDKKEKAAKDKDKAGKKDAGGAPKVEAAKGGGAPKGGGKSKEPREAKGAAKGAEPSDESAEKVDPNYKPRLRLHYHKAVVAALTKRFAYKNPMMVPRLQ